MKKIILIILLMFTLCSCSKNDEPLLLNGTFTEINPLPGRTKLVFFDGNKVSRTRAGELAEDYYYYRILGNKIEFTSIGDYTITTILDFERISNTKFRVENVYPAIPEYPKEYMVFVK